MGLHIFLICLFTYFCGNNIFAYDKNNEILIFYHIPKTGGTTVTSLLDQQFSASQICPHSLYQEIAKYPCKKLANFRFIRGHFFFHSNLLSLKNAKRICFLRDPVERVLSEQRYFEQKYQNNPILFQHHFLSSGQPIFTIKNQQCLFLSTYDRLDPNVTDAMHLKSAKYNLENAFFFVGITEEMKESIETLYTLMGWDIPSVIPRHNTTTENLKARDSAIIESIRQRNWADIELYEFAKTLFMQQRR